MDLGQQNGAAGIWPKPSAPAKSSLKTPQKNESPLLLPAEQVPLPGQLQAAEQRSPSSTAAVDSGHDDSYQAAFTA